MSYFDSLSPSLGFNSQPLLLRLGEYVEFDASEKELAERD